VASRYDVAIIGGGISGLALLHYLRRLKPDASVRLFEAETRLGGTIGTDNVDGYSLDWGPNGFLDREPLTLQLCDELGLRDRLERANDNVSKRFILRGGRLREVPMSPVSFMMSDILSLSGRLRVLMEPFVKRSVNGADESIYDFVTRRIGREAADYLVQPMVSGVYGGLANRLSLASCFPIMREMETEYGSLFKAMIAKARKARREGRKSGGPSGPAGHLTSFKGGLYAVIDRFAELYGDWITTGRAATELTRDNDEFHLRFADGGRESAKAVVLAVPAFNAAQMVGGLSNELQKAMASIPYAPISVVCLGYDSRAVANSLDGFGFLIPQKENRRILGSIWTSSIFADRAPDGRVQFRVMLGGDGNHEVATLSDDELVRSAREDLGSIIGVAGEPELVRVYNWQQGIPQYRLGHERVLERIEAELASIGNLYITGNAYRGIGLNDCVKQSHRVARQLV